MEQKNVEQMTMEELREEVVRLRAKMRQMHQIFQDDIQRAAREAKMATDVLKRAEHNSKKSMGR